MTDITDRLRARRVTNWVHATGESPVAAGFANDTLCCLAAAEIDQLTLDLQKEWDAVVALKAQVRVLREALVMCSTAGDGLTLAQEAQIRAALEQTK